MDTIFTIILLIHGIAHLPGMIVPWRIAEIKDMPYKTTLLSGKIYIGNFGVRIVGLLWLITGGAFVVIGVGVFLQLPWWRSLAFGVSVFSFILCILGWPDSRFGVFINVAILLFLMIDREILLIP